MARITITLTGTTALLCHNIQLSDPDNNFVRLIAEITSKRRKTDEDRREIERLEWFGGLYTAEGITGPVIPTANVRKCLIEAAKITRRGKQVGRALIFLGLALPIAYTGPRDLSALQKLPAFVERASVGVGQKRVTRVRPRFAEWSLSAEAEVIEDIMDVREILQVAERAGVVEGLGDNRVNGFGRFTATIERV